jgi:hypothetical protein
VVAAAVAWFDAEGIGRSELHATEDGLGVYQRHGYTESPWPSLRRRHPGITITGRG